MADNAEVLLRSVPSNWKAENVKEYVVKLVNNSELSKEKIFGNLEVVIKKDPRKDAAGDFN